MAVQAIPQTGVRSTRAGAAAVLAAVTIWAGTNTLIKLSDQPALAFSLYRLWVGAALLVAIHTLSGRRLTRAAIRTSAPAGALLGAEMIFFFSAIKSTSVTDTTMISALQPALVLLVAGRFFGEKITRREIVLTVVSLFGIALVTVGSSGTPVWSLKGDLFAVASVVAWTAYFLVSKRARSSVPALDYITVVMIAAACVITPIALLSGQPLGGLNAHDYLFLVLFVIGATGGHLLVTWAHAHVDVSVSSLLMLGLPVMSPLAALVVLGEPLAPRSIVGGAIVVGSLGAIVTRAARVGGGAELPPTETPQA